MKYYIVKESVCFTADLEYTKPTLAVNGNGEPRKAQSELVSGLLLVDKNACFAYDKTDNYGSVSLQSAGIRNMVHLTGGEFDAKSNQIELNKAVHLNGREPFDNKKYFVPITQKAFNSLCKTLDELIAEKANVKKVFETDKNDTDKLAAAQFTYGAKYDEYVKKCERTIKYAERGQERD